MRLHRAVALALVVFALPVGLDAQPAPKVTKILATPSDQFSGACAYADGATKATALMSVAFLSEPRTFRIFRSGIVFP